MSKKIIIGFLIIVGIGGVFYAGMVYGKRTTTTRGQFSNIQFSSNQSGLRGMGTRLGMNTAFTTGEILSKDSKSVTIKMQDGSTKIALVASSTQIVKSSTASFGDIVTGLNVTITGTANNDGSITAKNVQIRSVGDIR